MKDLSEALDFLAGGHFEGVTADDPRRTAVAKLLRSDDPPVELLYRIIEMVGANVDADAKPPQDTTGSCLIWRDEQLSQERRDLGNSLKFLDRGFTNARGREKSDVGFKLWEEAECRRAIVRLLSSPMPPRELLLSLASVFSPTSLTKNSEGLLYVSRGRLRLGHRRKGRNKSILRDEKIAEMMKRHRAECGSDRTAAVLLGEELGMPADTVRSAWKRWNRRQLQDGNR